MSNPTKSSNVSILDGADQTSIASLNAECVVQNAAQQITTYTDGLKTTNNTVYWWKVVDIVWNQVVSGVRSMSAKC